MGLMVLIVVLGIMNGFQENHISRRIEIGSFHINISKKDFKTFSLKEVLEFKKTLYDNFNEFEAVVPYTDREIILKIEKSAYVEDQIIKLRAIDPDEIIKDTKFLKYFKITYGKFDLSEYSALIGEALGYKILSRIGAQISLTPDLSLASLKNNGVPFNVSGFYYTGSYDYDRYWTFISLYGLAALTGKIDIENVGIKLKDKSKQKEVLKKLNLFLKNGYDIQTDEDINRGFFAALKLEKAMILFLFIMIFIMVAINTFGSLKLTISEKRKNIAILKALGTKPKDIEIIFLIGTLLVSFLGSLTGVILGCFVVYNVM
ncbi:MAG TPA: ABC transporter permease, partial [Spirochaetota bacterium]|nr:ABC transporter permease [Spirochaetota bacterium]